MADYYRGAGSRPDAPWTYNGGQAGWNRPSASSSPSAPSAPAEDGPAEINSLHQSRSAPFGRQSPEWKDIEGGYKMRDYYDGSSMRPDAPFSDNGGLAGWGNLHQRGPLNDFDIIQN